MVLNLFIGVYIYYIWWLLLTIHTIADYKHVTKKPLPHVADPSLWTRLLFRNSYNKLYLTLLGGKLPYQSEGRRYLPQTLLELQWYRGFHIELTSSPPARILSKPKHYIHCTFIPMQAHSNIATWNPFPGFQCCMLCSVCNMGIGLGTRLYKYNGSEAKVYPSFPLWSVAVYHTTSISMYCSVYLIDSGPSKYKHWFYLVSEGWRLEWLHGRL